MQPLRHATVLWLPWIFWLLATTGAGIGLLARRSAARYVCLRTAVGLYAVADLLLLHIAG